MTCSHARREQPGLPAGAAPQRQFFRHVTLSGKLPGIPPSTRGVTVV
jgi:hypothetical protein